MFNKSEIMKRAWKYVAEANRGSRPSTIAGRRRQLSEMLARAWAVTKRQIAEAARKAAMTAAELAMEEIAKINAAIEQLYYLPFAMNVSRRRTALLEERARHEAVLKAA